ncbi:facilitated trehalose transporter Tret1-like isoform X2 [Cimex lectularius]|nr:facilitated trehalose transporter Tret1-like isoform X2 [Cimex lectularius]XP_014242952.1 facilitated trehalose transporter Tret1-like isoform X2 [Cimex lectularius]
MIALSLPFSAAWYFYSEARTAAELFGVVTLHGLINGLLEAPILTYVAEVCEPDWRGTLASTSILFSLAGVFLQFFIGNYLDWRKAALVNVAVPLVSFVSICLIPESPHWLISRGRLGDAEGSLRWLRGWVGPEAVKKELEELTTSIQSVEGKRPFALRPYMKASFLKPFSMVVVSFLIGHFSGMSTLQTYAVGIFEDLKSPVGAYSATAAEGLVQFFGALLCVCILPFIGRRLLAITTTATTGVCLIFLAIVGEGWPAVVFLLISVFLINSCSKIFPWVLIGEVFSPDVRSVASGAASCIGYALGFLVNKTFFFSVSLFTLRGLLASYGVVSLLGSLYYFLLLPETEGRTLDEVQEHFRGNLDLTKEKRRRASSGVTNDAFSPEP